MTLTFTWRFGVCRAKKIKIGLPSKPPDNATALWMLWPRFKVTIRAVLAVRPSSAASKRWFSEAGWFLDDYTRDDLSFLEDWMRVLATDARHSAILASISIFATHWQLRFY
jgi:hypothetical protein